MCSLKVFTCIHLSVYIWLVASLQTIINHAIIRSIIFLSVLDDDIEYHIVIRPRAEGSPASTPGASDMLQRMQAYRGHPAQQA